MKQHLFVALPAYTGQIWVPTMQALFYSLWHLKDVKIQIEPVLFEAMIGRTRSLLATKKFLESEATDLLFVDSDIVWPVWAIRQLLAHPVDVVGGDYPRKMEPISYSARLFKKNGVWNTELDENGLLEVEALPTGFLRMTRHAVEMMVERYMDELRIHDQGEDVCNIFHPEVKWGEDYSFCKRWRAIGGKVHVDPQIKISHIGFRVFEGDYSEWLKVYEAYEGELVPMVEN